MDKGDSTVTRLIQGLTEAGGDAAEARARLLELVYEQLRAIAAQRMAGERGNHTLQPTALVHEAYLRLIGKPDAHWNGRAHFFRSAAEAMRRILIDHARARSAEKRGGGIGEAGGKSIFNVSNLADMAESADPKEIMAVDEMILRLGALDAQAADVVRLRFFAGLDEVSVGEVLGVSERTVRRDWAFARAWLRRTLEDQERRE